MLLGNPAASTTECSAAWAPPGPALVSMVIGRWLLKLEVPMLLGAIAGQQCSTPAISALVGVTGNATPVIGYTITYALSNVLLPLMGPVIVGLAGKLG